MLTVGSSVGLLRRGTVARLATKVRGAGVLRAASPARARVAARRGAAVTAAARRAPGRALVQRTTVRVHKAGEARVDVRLNRWGRLLLARRDQLRLPVRVTYLPTGGRAQSRTRRVTFKRPAPRTDRQNTTKRR